MSSSNAGPREILIAIFVFATAVAGAVAVLSVPNFVSEPSTSSALSVLIPFFVASVFGIAGRFLRRS